MNLPGISGLFGASARLCLYIRILELVVYLMHGTSGRLRQKDLVLSADFADHWII